MGLILDEGTKISQCGQKKKKKKNGIGKNSMKPLCSKNKTAITKTLTGKIYKKNNNDINYSIFGKSPQDIMQMNKYLLKEI